MSTFDLIVAGGGPAGLAAAIEARLRGMDVLVVEPRPYPIDKSCGEGLMPAAVASLDRLGVERPPGFPFSGIQIVSRNRCARGTFKSGTGLGVRRTDLSRVLHDRALETGVRFRGSRIRHVAQDGEGVDLAGTDGEDGMRGRWMIAADGLHSTVQRCLGLDVAAGGRKRWGVTAHFETEPWADCVEIQCSDAGEAYVTPLGDSMVGVALLSERSGSFDAQIHEYPTLQSRLVRRLGRDLGAGPFPRWMGNPRSGRVLFVGDAAGFIDPITGEGIQLGFAAAGLALDAIVTDDPDRYDREWTRMTRNYRLIAKGVLAVRRNPILDRLMIPVLQTFPVVFDRLLMLLGGPGGQQKPLSYQTTTFGGSSVLPPHSTRSS